jgi:hypothetical protein
MKKPTAGLLLLLCLALIGCWEFIEPEFAEQDAATVLQVAARINENGDLSVTGLLVPGLDDDGFVREVVRDTLYVFGIGVASDTARPTGSRDYTLSTRLSAQTFAQPFTIVPPVVSGINSGPPVRWATPRPLDPDTIRIAPGSDLVIRLAYDSAGSDPRPVQQWFMELSAGFDRFQIGANGPPPNTLLIPAMWIPRPVNGAVRVSFTLFQSAQVFVNDYRGVYSYTTQIDHTIIIR